MKSGIYLIVNLVNEKFYVGSSRDLKVRKDLHFSELRRGVHPNQHLQNSFNKYGEEAFLFLPILECPQEELLVKEQLFIDILKPIYNFCKTAGSRLGCKHSEETKKKLSEIQQGKVLSKEHCENISKGNKGKMRSQEAREKYSKAKTGTQMTEEGKQKLRVHNQKPINQYTMEGEFIKEWPGSKVAGESLKIPGSSVSQACTGRMESAGGFLWKFRN